MLGSAPGDNAATQALFAEIGRQALAIAYSNDFYLLAGATVLCVPLVLMLKRAKPAGQSSAPTESTTAAVADAAH